MHDLFETESLTFALALLGPAALAISLFSLLRSTHLSTADLYASTSRSMTMARSARLPFSAHASLTLI